jgi:mono/diheme cytochrome c family protein
VPVGPPWIRFRVAYYIFALIFVVFDIEAVFLYPWAVIFRTLGVVGLGLLLGVHQHIGLTPEQARQGNPVAATDASIARGREVYDQNCTQCHGLTGRGDGPLAKSLAVPPVDFNQHIPYHTDLFFFSVIGRGFGNIMPAFGSQISEEDRWNLINFLRAEHSLDSKKK